MPATPITVLTSRRAWNGIVNKRIKKYTALSSILFPESTRQNLQEEYAQVDVYTGSTGMAPFVKIGQKAVLVPSLNGTSYTIQTPFINIKRSLKYTTELAKRMAGQPVFSNSIESTRQAIADAMVQDADILNTMVDDRIEWMSAMMLRGTVTYSQEGYDAWTISTGKPSGNTLTAANLWTDTTNARPLRDLARVKTQMSLYRAPAPTIGICGAGASAALRELLETGKITAIQTTSGIQAGTGDLRYDLQENGMVFIARLAEVDFYEYLGKYTADVTGTETSFIQSDRVEFLSTSSRANSYRKLFFGLIPDLKAILEGNAVTSRYMDVKQPEFDQGTYEGLLQSRPLTWFEQPGWQASLIVTA